jgi:hypothetical protein
MPELPDRPDLDQLRRQARELLRAAADGQPPALARLRAVSDRVTLSAAQLALAREYGYPSWTALHTEIQRRRRLSATGRWSFGGATAIETAAGTLSIAGLVSGPDHATVDAWLLPARQTPTPLGQTSEEQLNAVLARSGGRRTPGFDDLTITDDRGTNYTLRVEYLTIPIGQPGQPARLHLHLVPAPARACAWLELRNRDGATTRLWPSGRPTVRVGVPTPASGSPAERELSHRALSIIAMHLSAIGEEGAEFFRQQCAAALAKAAKAAEVRQSGALDTASKLPDQLTRLCAALCDQYPADGLPPAWSGMLDAARRTDGPELHFDIAAALPLIADTEVQVDSLISEPGSWRLYLRATPDWWIYTADRSLKQTVLSVHAEDKLGGMYLGTFGGSSERGDYEEVTLQFLPRLDPLARTVKVTFSGTSEQVSLDLRLEPRGHAVTARAGTTS